MPKKNTTNVSEDAKIRLDQFIELNYSKLMDFALYQVNDPDDAQTILHDTIQKLYEGKRVLNLDGYPLQHFKHLLKSVRSHTNERRQDAFEDGYQVEVKDNKKQAIPIRITYGLPGELDEQLNTIPSFLGEIEKKEQYALYSVFKRTLSPKNQLVLTYVENGYTIRMVCEALADRGIHHNKHVINTLLVRLIKKINQKIGTVHLQVG